VTDICDKIEIVEVAGVWTEVNDWELHNSYPSPNISGKFKSRRMRLARNGYKVSSGKREFKGSKVVGVKCEDNIEGNRKLAAKFWTGFVWLRVDRWLALVNTVMNIWVHEMR
jgi:hypothetical protein